MDNRADSGTAQPHRRFTHVYVVMRLPRQLTPSRDLQRAEQDVMATKAFWSSAEAQAEATRLNSLNDLQWWYFVRVARLAEHPSLVDTG
jgi:hypothetical protein